MKPSKEQENEIDDNPFSYITELAISEVWGELKTAAVLWLLAAIALGIGATLDSAYDTKARLDARGGYFPGVPMWAWLALVFLLVTWFGRGSTLNHRVPRRRFRDWLLMSGGPVLFYALMATFPSVWFSYFFMTCVPIWILRSRLNLLGYIKRFKLADDPNEN